MKKDIKEVFGFIPSQCFDYFVFRRKSLPPKALGDGRGKESEQSPREETRLKAT